MRDPGNAPALLNDRRRHQRAGRAVENAFQPVSYTHLVEKEGYEADDIIGTLSHAAESQGGECTISTGDRDSFQLITDKVTVRLASNKEDIIYTPAKIAEVYGVTPREMLEVKTLMGCLLYTSTAPRTSRRGL